MKSKDTRCHLVSFDALATAAEGGWIDPTDARHLRRCAGCRDAVAALRDQAEALRRLAAAGSAGRDALAGLEQRILRRVRRDARERLGLTVRAVLRDVARQGSGSGSSSPDDGAPAAPPSPARMATIATLQRRLQRLDRASPVSGGGGGSGGEREIPAREGAPDGLLDLPAGGPELARRLLELLGRLDGWPPAPLADPHQPAASPSLRDSLAPR